MIAPSFLSSVRRYNIARHFIEGSCMPGLLKRASIPMLALLVTLPAPVFAQTAKTVPESQMQMQLSFAPLVKQTAGSVVNVYAERVVHQQSPFAGDPFFEQFFGQRMPNR